MKKGKIRIYSVKPYGEGIAVYGHYEVPNYKLIMNESLKITDTLTFIFVYDENLEELQVINEFTNHTSYHRTGMTKSQLCASIEDYIRQNKLKLMLRV